MERKDTRKERKYRKHVFSPAVLKEVQGLCRQIDNFHGPFAFFQDVLVISVAIALAIWFPLLFPLSLIAIGTRQRALDTLLHEAVHLTLARNRKLNHVIGPISGWSVFHTFHDYQKSHVKEHHVHLGDREKDPDTQNYSSQLLFDTGPEVLFRRHLFPRLFGLKTHRVIFSIFANLLRSFKKGGVARREVLQFLTFWFLVLTFIFHTGLTWYFILFWLVPYFTVFRAIEWLTDVAEHFPLVELYDSELMITRNRRGKRIEKIFTGIHNEDWHLVHHLHPGIPFWKLREAHEIFLQDPTYKEANQHSGGLFTSGPEGEPSIISLLKQQLSKVQLVASKMT